MQNNSSSAFSSDEMMSTIRELSAKMQSTPNAFVTTPRTLMLLLKVVKKQEQKHFAGSVPPGYLMRALSGIRVIECATVKDCLDRMMEPRKGERLKLVLSEDIPVDCLDHPWIKKQVSEMAERMGFA